MGNKNFRLIFGICICGLLIILGSVMYFVRYQGAMLYSMTASAKHAAGYNEAKAFENYSIKALLDIIEENKDFNKYTQHNLLRYLKGNKYAGAVIVLGSRTDAAALRKINDIIERVPEGQKWTAIGSIRDHKNKAMILPLCDALRKHSHWNTDRLVIDALVAIDDPIALDCLIQEKGKIKSSGARKKAEKAIEKWSK